MKSLLVLVLLVSAACRPPAPRIAAPPSREPPTGSARFGVFVGRVPCPDCVKVKVRLTLHRSALDDSPTTYVLERVETGPRLVTRGTWSQTGDVITLGGSPEDFSRYLLVRDRILLLLDRGLEPRLGYNGFSFALWRGED